MKEEIKQATEVIASHPKTNIAITAALTSNVWIDYGEPVVKGLTSVLGLVVLILLLVKHVLDIKKELSNTTDKDK